MSLACRLWLLLLLLLLLLGDGSPPEEFVKRSPPSRVKNNMVWLMLTTSLVARRTALLSTLVPSVTQAYWQLWQPDDMLDYVAKYGETGDAASVLRAMDKCAETSWMMQMGVEKGGVVERVFEGRRRILEIGTFLGYMTIRMARGLPSGGELTTVEKDPVNYRAATEILAKALPADQLNRVHALHADVRDLLRSKKLKGPFDAVLMDHWKADYRTDLELLASNGLLMPGALVVADNVLFPGAPEFLDYLGVPYESSTDELTGQPCLVANTPRGTSPSFDTRLVGTSFEYRPETPDALSISTYKRS